MCLSAWVYGFLCKSAEEIQDFCAAEGNQTDGRFSGASTGPVIGHCSPEAADGGPIALVEEGDLIEIDIAERKLNIIGIKGEKKSSEEIDAILAERRKNWKPKEMKYKKGALRLFSEHAVSPMKGAYLAYED